MSTKTDLSQDHFLVRLSEIHETKTDIFKEICQLNVTEGTVFNWIRGDLHCIKYMTRTLAEIIHSLHPDYNIKNKKNQDGWIWAP
jgi:hypothetical protein